MEKQNENINIDDILIVIEQLIPETEPKTRLGRWFRWIDKLIKLKNAIGLKFKKPVN